MTSSNPKTIAAEVPLTLDLAALKAQAAWLAEQQGIEAEGLMGLLDAIRDYLIDHEGVAEEDVLNITYLRYDA